MKVILFHNNIRGIQCIQLTKMKNNLSIFTRLGPTQSPFWCVDSVREWLGCCNHCWLVFWGLSWCQFECEWLRLVWTHQLTIYLWAPHLFLATETQTSSVRWNSNYDGAGRGDAVMRDNYDKLPTSLKSISQTRTKVNVNRNIFQMIFSRLWSPRPETRVR